MPIRYRRVPDAERPAREGEVDTVGELEALVTIGTLGAKDEVALDGTRFAKARDVPELKQALRERGETAGGGSVLGKVLLIAGAGLVGLVALGFVLKLASVVLTLAALAAAAAGIVWLIRKLR